MVRGLMHSDRLPGDRKAEAKACAIVFPRDCERLRETGKTLSDAQEAFDDGDTPDVDRSALLQQAGKSG